jgi:hypothetical protein
MKARQLNADFAVNNEPEARFELAFFKILELINSCETNCCLINPLYFMESQFQHLRVLCFTLLLSVLYSPAFAQQSEGDSLYTLWTEAPFACKQRST